MTQISISKAVGHQALSATAADVKTIQCCLNALKYKPKGMAVPFYAGKIDGKAGPKTIAGIKAFQACFGFKDTGKIMPGSAEIRKLREKAPMGVLKDIERATMGDETAGPASMARQKAIRAGAQTSQEVKTKAPLPKAEADDLAKLIAAASKKGVPLTADAVDINDQGRFTVSFTVNYAALPSGIPKSIADERSRVVLKDATRASLQWHQPNQSKLYVTSRTAYGFLKGVKEPSKEYLERMGLKSERIDPARKKLLGAAECLERRKLTQ